MSCLPRLINTTHTTAEKQGPLSNSFFRRRDSQKDEARIYVTLRHFVNPSFVLAFTLRGVHTLNPLNVFPF